MKKIKIFLIILFFFIFIIFFGKLVSLKYVSNYVEGSMTSDYYDENISHDVIFIGDCEAYTSFSPIEIYKNTGINSYVRGNSSQLIFQSYYILLETLKYEKPKIVVLSVGAMRYDKPKREEYNRLMLDKMKWSIEKISLIKHSMLDEESFITYVFPLLRYHDRITKLESDDFKYLFGNNQVTHNGFIINQNIKPLNGLPKETILNNYIFSENNYKYLQKIIDVCKKENIKLILYKSPNVYPYWYKQYNDQIKKISLENNLDYYNFIDYIDEIGINFKEDTYDSGAHLNLNGAIKLSKYFSTILKDKYQMKNYKNDININNIYERKIKRYDEEIN